MPRRTPRPVVAGAVLVALALVFVGYLIGLSSPWSAHKPTVVSGTVERVRSDVPWAVFTPDGGGEQVEVYLDQVVWRTERTTGSESVPPCLRRENASITAEVGMIEVSRPFGSGSYWKILSLTCPPGT